MRTKKHGDWCILEITSYELQVLLKTIDALKDMAEGNCNGIVIGGANIEIQLKD